MLTDTVTSPFATVGVVNDGGTESLGVVTWTLTAPVAAGASGSVSFTVDLASVFPAGETVVSNVAVATSPDDPTCALCTSPPVTTTVTAGPALKVTKSVDLTTAVPGDTLTYTVNYTNEGNAAASGVVLTDTVTSPFATVGVVNDGGTESLGVVTWTLTAPVAAGASGSVSFTVDLASVFPAGETVVSNVAVATSPDDPTCALCTSPPVTTTVTAGPALKVTKSVDLTTAVPGDTLTYTVTSPFATVGVVNDGGTESLGVVTWTLTAPVAAGASGSVSFTVDLASVFPAGETVVSNVAVATSPDDPTCALCTSPPVTTTVTAGPALKVTKSVDLTTAVPGDTLTYTVNYTNEGNAAASGVVLTDTVTSPFATVGVVNDGGTESLGVVTWTLTAPVAAGASGSVSFTVDLASVFPAGETVVSNVAVATSPDDPTCALCTSPPVTTTVTAGPALKVTKSVDLTTAVPGDTLTYTVNYTNEGNAAASGVVLTDTVTSPFATVGVVNDGGTESLGVVTWTLTAPVAAGASGSVSFTVDLASVFPAGETVVSNVAVATSPDDPTCALCTSPPVTTTVTAGPVLELTKTVDKVTALPGETLVYTLSYQNTGNADAASIAIDDYVPTRAKFASASPTATIAPAVGSTGLVEWTLGPVAAGSGGVVTLTVTLDSVFPAGTTPVINSAVVTGPGVPPTPPTPPVTTTMTAEPVLVLIKTVDKATALPGETLVYTLTYENTGNADATGATITDALPALTTFVSATGGTETAGVVTWSPVTVAAGTSGSVTLTVTLDSVFPASTTAIDNMAAVTGPLPKQTSNTVTTTVTLVHVYGRGQRRAGVERGDDGDDTAGGR